MSASPEDIAKAFVQHYYQTFDTNRAAISGLYKDVSMLSWEGEKYVGSAIGGKLTSIPGDVAHDIKTLDVQPSTSPNALIVFVSGEVKIGGPNPLRFAEFFQLVSTGPGAFYVHNHVMRLNYA